MSYRNRYRTPSSSPQPDGLRVGVVAEHLGITVRTLHHWDEIGLAKPSVRSVNGYRLYTAGDIARLQRIVIYRALDLPLDQIAELIDSTCHAKLVEALEAQRDRVDSQISYLNDLKRGLTRMIDAQKHGINLTAEQQAEIFGEDWQPDLMEEAHAKWGNTPQWVEFAEKAAKRSPEDWKAMTAEAKAFEQELGAAFDKGVEPGSPEANALAEQHKVVFSNAFTISTNMQVCLGHIYARDPRFSAYYEKVRPGLADWLSRVIDENARAKGIDPDRAVWE